jgi:hypothetical protein
MRSFIGLLGIVVFILGVAGVLGGRIMVDRRDDAGGIVFWAGVAMVVMGPTISSAARHKTCSHCKMRVKAEATRCEVCGNPLG